MRKFVMTALTLVAFCSSAFAVEATETPTKGYRWAITTSAGTFVRCTEYGHLPKCNGEPELPYAGGFAHQVVRTPTGKTITVFPLGYIDDFVTDLVEVQGGIYMLASHTLYRYDTDSDMFVLAYRNRSFRITGASATSEPYFALSEGRGHSQFEGLLLPDTSGKWQEFLYEGPRLRDAERLEVSGGLIVLTHYSDSDEQPAVTKFDPATGKFTTR